MNRVGILLCAVALLVVINAIILLKVNKNFLKDDKISSKKFILVGILSQIISMVISYLVVIGLLAEVVGNMVRILLVLFYILVELFIIKYWLKISWKKSIIVCVVPIICWILVLVIIGMCEMIFNF